MTRTHTDMRELAKSWLGLRPDGSGLPIDRSVAINEQHLALDVLELVGEVERRKTERDELAEALAYELCKGNEIREEVERIKAENERLRAERPSWRGGVPVSYEDACQVVRVLHDQIDDLQTRASVDERNHWDESRELRAEARQLRAQLATAQQQAERMSKVYEAALQFPKAYGGKLVAPPGDWACKECKPHSDWPHIGNGWRCPVHALLSAIDAGKETK